MKKFRLISAVSVAVLSMSVQAMAMPLSADATSLQCTKNTTLKNCITNISNNDSTSKNCLKSVDIDSILKDCSSGKRSSTLPNFNCDLNGGSVAKNSCSKGSAVKGRSVKVSAKKVSAKKVSAKKVSTNNVCADKSTCTNSSCTSTSADKSTCTNDSCTNTSANKSTCTNGSCTNTPANSGSANNGSVDKGSANNTPVDKGTANNGSVDKGSANNTPVNSGSVSNDTSSSISAYAQKVVDLVNVERAKQGISPLAVDADVTEAAQVRAKEIQSSFSHTRPDGRSCFTALDEAGASYRGAGENIALGQKTPEQVVNDWMNSEGHRKNIMNSNFKYIGVGVDGTAWTQLFTY